MADVHALPPLVHDPEALWAARYEVRRAYEAIRRLRQADPVIRETLTQLDSIAVEITLDLESNEPELPLEPRSVRVIPIGELVR